jgi:xanthine dehydrogenase molybdopterin-binding subunit B
VITQAHVQTASYGNGYGGNGFQAQGFNANGALEQCGLTRATRAEAQRDAEAMVLRGARPNAPEKVHKGL